MSTNTGTQTKAQHTAAPWDCNLGNGTHLQNDVTIWGNNCQRVVGEVGDSNAPNWTREDVANARLIAAAPDLLEACKALLSHLAYGHEALEIQAAAAIAKAEGRS